MQTEWEYKVWNQGQTGINPDSEEDLNYLGSKDGGGWELVATREVPVRIGDSIGMDTRWYFKRPKQSSVGEPAVEIDTMNFTGGA